MIMPASEAAGVAGAGAGVSGGGAKSFWSGGWGARLVWLGAAAFTFFNMSAAVPGGGVVTAGGVTVGGVGVTAAGVCATGGGVTAAGAGAGVTVCKSCAAVVRRCRTGCPS